MHLSLTANCVTYHSACREQRGIIPRAHTLASLCVGVNTNLWLSLPILIVYIRNNLICCSFGKVFLHAKTGANRSIGNYILPCFGKIRLPDNTKEPTQQPFKLLRTPCFLCFVLPWNNILSVNAGGKIQDLMDQVVDLTVSHINNQFLPPLPPLPYLSFTMSSMNIWPLTVRHEVFYYASCFQTTKPNLAATGVFPLSIVFTHPLKRCWRYFKSFSITDFHFILKDVHRQS